MDRFASSPTRFLLALTSAAIFCAVFCDVPGALAQAGPQGPMNAPEDHHVTRIGTEAASAAPPALPPAEIIKRFAQKEDEYFIARARYGFRKTVRIQEFGPDGNPSGELLRVADYTPEEGGKVLIRPVQKTQSTLQYVYLGPEDFNALDSIPAYPFTTDQLRKYEFKYLGKEQVDEIDCYIFKTQPKTLERKQAYFDGIVWVDAKYLEVVKTYGKWITDQGAIHAVAQLPFSLFETYRENTGGKFWFPNYSRSDDTFHLKDSEIPMRIVMKWADFKLAGAPAEVTAAPTDSAQPVRSASEPESPKR